jgi:hypothetical protein
MNTSKLRLAPLVGALVLGACTTIPPGPSVMALPGTGKSFDQFRADDMMCQQYAQQQIGGMTPGQAQADAGVKSAAVGALLGAVAGAAIDGSHGAGVGAGAGLLMGGAAGAGAANASGYELQRRYDFSYQQCMYAQGHRVPVYGNFGRNYRDSRGAGGYAPAYPPPNYPPPPGY